MDTELTPSESLKLIERMIGQAKRSFHRMSFYFLMWGVLLIVATLVEYVMTTQGREYSWAAWPIMGLLGGILSGIHGAREGREQPVETIMDRVVMWIWASFVITLIVLIACSVATQRSPGPWVTILTGLPTFATGAITRFKPLMIGGVLFWSIGAVSCFVPGTVGALLFAGAMLCGYIVPGIMLKQQEDALRAA